MKHPSLFLLFTFSAVAVTKAADPPAKQPADAFDGPPYVTAKAWAIADGKTGELLWGKDESIATKAASTAKMMNCWVVIQLAKQDPKVLNEVVTISKYADSITGSTADVRAGEQLSVNEMLYAMMLPSGNDAATALAEHFNERLAPLATKLEPVTARTNFISEMNRRAQQLGMRDTTYRSVYGDGGTETDATISPRDLLKLAHAAMQDPLFRRIVATQSHSTELRAADGSSRRAEWTNTNELLKIAGYDGIKTGTTNSAGSCLVSSGRRGNDHLLIVVLGAATNPARFVDSRNLFRWAWLKRGHKP